MIYLNNTATTFPKPQEVIDVLMQNVVELPCHSSRTGLERENDDVVYLCRQSLAKLFNIADPLQIVLTSGSTESLNLAIHGIDIKGKHVVTTEIEHNSVIRPLKHLERNGEIKVTFVPCDSAAYVAPEAIEKAIRPDTAAVIVNHASNVTGTVLDIKRISEIAHAHNCILIVDGSQSAGNVPIDVQDMDIDYLAFTGHKSLYGIMGTGGLYIKPGLNPRPLKVGGTGTYSEVLYQPEGFPIHYEAGTPNLPGIAALGAGVNYILKKGVENLRLQKEKLVKMMINELKDEPGITIYNRTEKTSYTNFCFNVEGFVPEEAGYFFDSAFDIMVRTGLHCAPLLLKAIGAEPWGTIRVSPSSFTTVEDIELFIKAVRELRELKPIKK